MGQPSSSFDLSLKTLDGHLRLNGRFGEDLYGDLPLHASVKCEEDLSHSALTDLIPEFQVSQNEPTASAFG
jgi:hypothetical protein